MNRRTIFLALLVTNLILFVVLFWLYHELTSSSSANLSPVSLIVTSALTPSATAGASSVALPSTTRPAPTDTPTSTITPSPTRPAPTRYITATTNPVPTKSPTAKLDTDPQIETLLERRPDAYCPPRSPVSSTCRYTSFVSILEYLDTHPNIGARSKLEDKLFDLAHRLPFDSNHTTNWLADDWVNTILPARLEATADPAANVPYLWNERMRVIPTDIDQNGKTDYVVGLRYDEGHSVEPPGSLFWIHYNGSTPIVEDLHSEFDPGESRAPRDLWVGDFNADGLQDIVYTANACGASNCIVAIRYVSYDKGVWRTIPRVSYYSALNGGWQLNKLTDGTYELIMDVRDGGSLGSFTASAIYELHFRWRNGEYLPVLTSAAPQLGAVQSLAYSEQLMRERRYADAIATLQQVFTSSPPEAADIDYRPFALYRIGLLYLYLDDVTNAQRAWQELITTYPDLPISQDMSRARALAQSRQDLFLVCQWLAENAQDWTPKQDFRFTNPGYLLYFRQGLVCDSNQILPVLPWSRATSLESQMRTRGLDWQTVSTQYDLNGDGINDPIGLLENRVPWVMLTYGDQYNPFLVINAAPAGAIPEMFSDSLRCKFISVTDINLDHAPELVQQCDYAFEFWQWRGNTFSRFTAYCPAKCEYAVLSIEPKTGLGTIRLQDTTTQPTPEYPIRQYELREQNWVWVIPTEEPPKPPIPNPPPSLLSEIIRLIFREQDPSAALSLLNATDPLDPDHHAAYQYMRAIAYNKLGDTVRATALWAELAELTTDTAWGRRAKERLERGW